MNHFKLFLLNFYLCVLVVAQINAQPNTGSRPHCDGEPIPHLYIWDINYDLDRVNYNRWDFYKFDGAQIERREHVRSQTDRTPEDNPYCPSSGWVIVPDIDRFLIKTDTLEDCVGLFDHGFDYDLRVAVLCGDSILYTQIRTFTYMEQSDRLISEINEADFEFYPQPAFDYLFLKTKSDSKINSLTIFNMSGQQLLTMENKDNLSELKIEVSELATGLYTAKIKLEDQSEYFRKLTIHSK